MKKKRKNDLSCLMRGIQRFLLIFRLATLLILLALTVSAGTYSENTKLNFSLENVTIEQVLLEIENNSRFIFIYESGTIDKSLKKTISVKDQTIDEILTILLEGTDVAYSIDDRQVLLYRKDSDLSAIPLYDVPSIQIQQPHSFFGKVIDSSGIPLPGVTVVIKGSTKGTVTNADGNYSLSNISSDVVLVFSFVGMKTQEIPVGGKTSLNVVMEADAIGIEEVVAVAYGTQTKTTITGAISSVKSDEITKAPTATVGNALTGKIPGLQTIQRSGQPGGDAPEIYLRGVASLSLGRSSPIFVLDGIIQSGSGSIMQLDPNTIESISVLKDASATAVYGVQGANGAIVVETKRGKKGPAKISLNASAGLQVPTYIPEFCNSYETALAYNEAQLNDGVSPDRLRFSDEAIEAFRTGSDPLIYPDMDWVDYMTKPSAFQSRSNINISGGTEDVRYFIAGGYLKQDGFFKTFETDYDFNPTYDRYNFRSNIDIDITSKTTVSLTAGGRLDYKTTIRNPNLWYQIYRSPPYGGAGLVDGKVIDSGKGTNGSNKYIPGFTEDIFQTVYGSGYNNNSHNDLNLDLSVKQKLDVIAKGLEIQVKGAYNIYSTRNRERSSSVAIYQPYYRTDLDPAAPGDSTIVFQKVGSDDILNYSESYDRDRDWYMEARLNYSRDFGSHKVKGLLMYNQSKNYYPGELPGIPRGLVSTLGRVNYNYGGKYLLEFSMGYNGSENFARERRFGFFPAVSGGWILTREKFMPDLSFLDFLKIRASYGIVGNDSGIGRFLYLPDQYDASSGGYNFGIEVPQDKPGASEGRVGNSQVTWEKSEKQNYGIDIRLFKDKLDMAFDYFHEYRSNILTTLNTIPAYITVNLPAVNIGEVKNSGYEVQVNWRQQTGDLFYSLGGNMAFARNKILFMDEVLQPEPYMQRTGHPVSQAFGYVFEGYYTEDDLAPDSDIPTPPYAAKPGDLKYKDLNGDRVVNSNDQRAIGFPEYPEYTFGVNFGIRYKSFDLSMQWAGATNVSRVLEAAPFRVPFGGNGQLNIIKYQWEERWTPEKGQDAGYPRLSLAARGRRQSYTSDYWMRDASYLRLKNAEIGYSFNSRLLKNIGLSRMRIYLSGYNLLTFSSLDIIDPEQSGKSSQSEYPLMRVYNLGVNVDF
ncbi:TonB-dependent receptor [Gaoshiqia sediminis]|uniref:TonB-dependent receptor n=1 Tax=Gaoshiqia sediminis TaxID=2986998 RepID=A0AA41YCL9_9BACT|nr:TonB-dependent receptor [Gaoshiqia sediminis]MCW0483925.1 TonB-dependent receptor [Gaoshiqia sediminis]